MSLQIDDLRPLFELSRDPVLGIDSQGKIAFANPAATALLGVQPEDSAERALPKDILNDPAAQFIASVRVGEQRASVSVNRLDGLTVCTYSLPQSKSIPRTQSSTLQTFAKSLMNLRMALDVLVSRTNAKQYPVIKEASQTLYREYHRLLRICQHMTYATDIEQGDLPHIAQVVDLKTLCQELCDTVGNLYKDHDISIQFTAEPALYLTMADSKMLEIMLANILTNSLAHCEAGDVIKMDLTRQDDRFIIALQDTGSGITPERVAGIFNDVSAPDPSDPTVGAGLGLYIARGIAERHGGHIIMESRPGSGTSIRVSIPYKQAETLLMKSPAVQYRSDGMNVVLTELSPILDKQYYCPKWFD